MLKSVLAISAGASLGAILRWQLAQLLNAIFPSLPMGTLAANLSGAYLAGIAVSLFAAGSSLSPELRLFVITGFLGALTTFSAFSTEVAALIQQGRPILACGAVSAHVLGSLLMTFLGIGTFSLFKQMQG